MCTVSSMELESRRQIAMSEILMGGEEHTFLLRERKADESRGPYPPRFLGKQSINRYLLITILFSACFHVFCYLGLEVEYIDTTLN